MSTNLKWTQQHEMELINDVTNGKNLNLFAQSHNRSISAVELRLKKIIYENHTSGVPLQKISQLLKLDLDKITQYYYSYKEFKEKRKPVEPVVQTIVEPVAHVEPSNNLDKIESKLKKLEAENRILKLVIDNKNLNQQLNELIVEGKVNPNVKHLIKIFKKSIKN